MMSLLHCCVKPKEDSGTARGYRFRRQEGSELCEEERMRETEQRDEGEKRNAKRESESYATDRWRTRGAAAASIIF